MQLHILKQIIFTINGRHLVMFDTDLIGLARMKSRQALIVGPIVASRKAQILGPVMFHFEAFSCAVLFLGGADSREALAYADRMPPNPEVSLTVIIWFLSYNIIGDDEMEKKLDGEVVVINGEDKTN
ncbi:hypothetical protein OIU78_008314 [Salix suchowensis]|nr:hypothetical protein OIU78_008314 [Salix suchowensis]